MALNAATWKRKVPSYSGKVVQTNGATSETQLSYVLDGRGLVVPPESPEMLAERLRRLADDAPLRARLGKAAGEYAEQHLDKERVWTGFLEKLRDVCDSSD